MALWTGTHSILPSFFHHISKNNPDWSAAADIDHAGQKLPDTAPTTDVGDVDDKVIALRKEQRKHRAIAAHWLGSSEPYLEILRLRAALHPQILLMARLLSMSSGSVDVQTMSMMMEVGERAVNILQVPPPLGLCGDFDRAVLQQLNSEDLCGLQRPIESVASMVFVLSLRPASVVHVLMKKQLSLWPHSGLQADS